MESNLLERQKVFSKNPSSCPVSIFGLYETYAQKTLKFVIIKPITKFNADQ